MFSPRRVRLRAKVAIRDVLARPSALRVPQAACARVSIGGRPAAPQLEQIPVEFTHNRRALNSCKIRGRLGCRRTFQFGGAGEELFVPPPCAKTPSTCRSTRCAISLPSPARPNTPPPWSSTTIRSEEHTSELQSLRHLVCRLL